MLVGGATDNTSDFEFDQKILGLIPSWLLDVSVCQ